MRYNSKALIIVVSIVLAIALTLSIVQVVWFLSHAEDESTAAESTSKESPAEQSTTVPSGEDDPSKNSSSAPPSDTPTPETPPDRAPIDFSNMTYVAFGDSITWGGYPLANGEHMKKSYPVLVGETLGLNLVTNCAVSGSTIAYHENLTNVTSQLLNAPADADIVSVMIGVNDYTFMSSLGSVNDNTTATVYGGLNVLVHALKEQYPDAFIFFITPYPCYVPAWGEITQAQIVQAIKTVCASNNIPCLDLHSNGQFTLGNDPSSDGVHPSQQFTNNYTAPQIVQFIREKCNEASPENTPVDFTSRTYAAIGDSITYGFCGDHSKPAFANNYPACLQSNLGLQSVTNLGACGCLVSRNTNPAFTSMIDKVDLIPANTDIISVFGGINDFVTYTAMGDINSTDEYTIYGAFNAIASKLKANHPDAFVFFITPLPIGESNLAEIQNAAYTVRDICNAILEIGEKWDIPVYDANLYADFNPDTDSFDGCHPTEAYYATVFSAKLTTFIRENYQ